MENIETTEQAPTANDAKAINCPSPGVLATGNWQLATGNWQLATEEDTWQSKQRASTSVGGF